MRRIKKNSRTKPKYREETVAVGLVAVARAAQLKASYRSGVANWLCADGASGLVGGMAFPAVCQVFERASGYYNPGFLVGSLYFRHFRLSVFA